MGDFEDENGLDAVDGSGAVKSCYFFAGGGTGGHIYPAIAIAEKIRRTEPEAGVLFLCSERAIDSRILSGSGFEFVALPGRGFSVRPDRALSFFAGLLKGYDVAKKTIISTMRDKGAERGVMIGVGGFASVGAILAAGRVGLPLAMVNVDMVPGRANKLLGRFAEKIFVQFADTAEYFGKARVKVVVTGCPLRESFSGGGAGRIIEELGLDSDKKTVVVTGASSGSLNINRAVAKVLRRLDEFADAWQVVHLTGSAANTRRQRAECDEAKIDYHLVDYCEDMAGLYAIADIVVGRAGAVSVAEFAASGTPAICLPYPYHKDRHQYLNAGKLVEAGAAVAVDDIPDDTEQTAESLLRQLKELMGDDERREAMTAAARKYGNISAAEEIAEALRHM